MSIITPKPISGFPELLPDAQIVFNRCLQIVRETYELFGFAPIETPAVERKEILTSKGGDEKEIFALTRLFTRPDESPETDLALHFDLTVPLARYVAQNKDKLVFPFRRYQMQKIWRGERPQKGRYREFYQCDIDVIGRGSVSLFTDAEIPSVIYQVFKRMDIGHFVIRINNRRLLQGYFEYLGVPNAQIGEVLRAVDRLEKEGRDKVRRELTEKIGVAESAADDILAFIGNESASDTDAVLAKIQASPAMSNERFAQGAAELNTVIAGIRSLGVPDDYFRADLSIARGLGYYTGTVYETQLIKYPELGSICSGGRYDDLASYFTTEKLPGVGISIGLSRLVIQLIEAGVLKTGPSTPAPVIVTTMDTSRMADYLKIAASLREAGIATEVYFDKGRLGDQLKYANRKGFKIAIIAGENEFAAGQVKVKNLITGQETLCEQAQLLAHVVG
ncbi:MAG: histidine--tRNA ligase [Anaerolineae bacterium]|nr:histidine--tRNA ligase [Anaerolineae bacterium]